MMIVLCCNHVTAQTEIVPDSIKTYRLDEVLIHAQRLSSQMGFTTTQLQKNDIEQSSAKTLGEIIGTRSGIFVKDYGGSGIKTISQRGLGTEHTVILMNGMRISSMQNGVTDLGMFPLEEIEMLEIAQGGYSALVGADAIGGVLNLVTIPVAKENKFRMATSFGSFGSEEFSTSATLNFDNINIQAGLGQQQSRGNFPFAFSNGSLSYDLERKNVDMRAKYGNLQTSIVFQPDELIHIAGYLYESERGIGGLIVGPVNNSKARQADDEGVLQIHYNRLMSKTTTIGLHAQLHHQYERYNDPLLNVGGKPLDNYFKNNELRFEPNYFYRKDSSISITIGGEVVKTIGEGNVLNNTIERNQYAAYLQSDLNFTINSDYLSKFELIPTVRYDVISSLLNSFNPQIETRLMFNKISFLESELTLRMNISKNFRTPTFNELYWKGGGGIGNPDLNGERATNVDGGMVWHFVFLGNHSLSVTYYHISMEDRIVWTAAGYGIVTPKNIRSVSSNGFETSYHGRFYKDMFVVDANYTNGSSIKRSEEYVGDPTTNNQLPFIPEEMMNIGITVRQEFDESIITQAGLTISHQFIGYRFTTEDNSNFLPGYRLTDANVRFKVHLGRVFMNMKFEVENIFNQEYQIMPAYPMPGRSYRFSFSVELT